MSKIFHRQNRSQASKETNDAGIITGIFVAKEKEQLPISVGSVNVIAHRGLVGDRYYAGSGTFSGAQPLGPGREITLIEEENIIMLAESLGHEVDACLLRRNMTTHGVRLNDLVGQQFMIGNIRLLGVRLCHPCPHLERLSGWNVRKYLKEKGGLRADILESGTLHVGDVANIHPDEQPQENQQ